MNEAPYTREELDDCIRAAVAEAALTKVDVVHTLSQAIMRLTSQPREHNTKVSTVKRIALLRELFKEQIDPNIIWTQFENNETGITYTQNKYIQNLIHYAVQYGMHAKKENQ